METSRQCYDGPLTGNLKCVVLSALLAGGYWFAPPRNKWVLLGILYFTYLALAWYDYAYECERTFQPTYLRHFYEFLKPRDSKQSQLYARLCPSEAHRIVVVDVVVLFGFLAAAPAFLRWKPTAS